MRVWEFSSLRVCTSIARWLYEVFHNAVYLESPKTPRVRRAGQHPMSESTSNLGQAKAAQAERPRPPMHFLRARNRYGNYRTTVRKFERAGDST